MTNRHSRSRSRAWLASAIALAILLVFTATVKGGAAGSAAPQTATLVVTPKGVGALRLGATAGALHDKHLIGRLRPGCELDPGQRVARLRAPLQGFAVFSRSNRLFSLQITKGAQTGKGIGIGSTPKEAQQAYPKAEYDPPGTVPPFAQGFVWVNRVERPKMTFTVDSESHLIVELNVHAPNACE
jgi:hypothetical protein